MKKIKKPVTSIGNILIYDDENITYYKGVPFSISIENEYITNRNTDGSIEPIRTGIILNAELKDYEELENIKLDDTTMKRIAKFNKCQEINRLDKEIKKKQNKIKQLDDFLQDKEKRIKKLKEFVADIYEINVNDNEYEDEYEDEYYD